MITIDADLIDGIKDRLGEYRKKTPVVLFRALNRAADSVKVNASKKARETYTAKASSIKPTFRIRRASRTSLIAKIVSEDGSLPLDKFKMRPGTPQNGNPRRHLKVQVKKAGGVKELVGGFVANISGAKAFERADNSRHVKGKSGRWTELPIKRMFGPAVPVMVGTKPIRDYVEVEAEKVFTTRLEHEIKRTLEGN